MLVATGAVLLGPPDLLGQTLDLPSLSAAQRNERGHVRETWPDGREYLVGYSRDQGFDAYPGLGWRVLVRQDTDQAFAPVNQLHQRMLMGGFVLAALFSMMGWLVARRISQVDMLRSASSRSPARCAGPASRAPRSWRSCWPPRS